MSDVTTAPGARARIQALDALRGFALCGIILINIEQTFGMVDVPPVVANAVRARFFVIFSLLFGIGFGIFLERAAARHDRPRLLLLRRLLVLGVLGVLHMLLQPGEVLRYYAVFGLLVLLPLSFAPRAVNLVVGLLALVGAMLTVGTLALIPGLFLIGYAMAMYGVPTTLPERSGVLAAWLAASTVAALAVAQLPAVPAGTSVALRPSVLLPMLMSFAYMAAFLLLLRSPLRAPLEAVLVPLGRLALTNYLVATIVFVPAGRALGLEGSAAWATATALAAGILVVQAVLSPWWLRGFRYGPFEWVWRCATWWQVVPLRREEDHVGHAVVA